MRNGSKNLKKIKVEKEDILIGTSAGAAFLVRWLGKTKKKIKKLILVAPAIIAREGLFYLEEFYNFKIDKKIKERFEKIIIFTSDNDEEPHLESAKILNEELGGEFILIKGAKHFTTKGMGTKEFPELLEKILD
ncbi:MAG: alpha/beta hydrolase [Nanoarchaeota archaeon]|nr:alpha/beta hydrolase [Nanoarchaeota archaeon]